jgi:7-carboxy-7-deazaguanine synthase
MRTTIVDSKMLLSAALARGDDPKVKVPTLRVSEIYGPVCQGEGALIGRPTIFVRLGGCDYRCSWCDSLYAVLPEYRKEWKPYTAWEIVATVKRVAGPYGTRHVTLSGGNPAIHDCGQLVDELQTQGYLVAVETQGSIDAYWLQLVDHLTISPKPPSSGNVTLLDDDGPLDLMIRKRGWDVGSARLSLKVVVFDERDYDYAVAVHKRWPRVPFYVQAGTLVGEASRDDLCDALNALQTQVLMDPNMHDVAVLPQLHAILKGHARGI